MKEVKVKVEGLSFGAVLTILFIALKLTGCISWSWWWVLCLIWIPVVLYLGVLIIMGLWVLIAGLFDKPWKKRNR